MEIPTIKLIFSHGKEINVTYEINSLGCDLDQLLEYLEQFISTCGYNTHGRLQYVTENNEGLDDNIGQ